MNDVDFFRLHDRVKQLEAQVRKLAAPTTVLRKRIGAADIDPPTYAKEDDSGMDLRADLTWFARAFNAGIRVQVPTWLEHERALQLDHGSRITIGCGWAFRVPDGYELQVRPRSGGSVKGLDIAYGTVDRGYRGEVTFTVINNTGWQQTITHADRVAQLALARVATAACEDVDDLGESARGQAGHGSTGVR